MPVVISYPPDLPVSQRREEIMAAIRAHQTVIVAGETGSGKTTQLPKMCLELGLAERGLVGCTQPRRVAAMSVSRRVAEELRVPWGQEVGCKIRFNDDTSRETKLKFMTDGVLLAEIQSDPLLRRYSALIIDEAHERSLNIDFLLGHLKGVLRKRPDLKLIITSATIDTEAFSAAFDHAPVIEVSGRLYPVELRHTPLESYASRGQAAADVTEVEAACKATRAALREFPDGDILIFMPTERDIRETCDDLEGDPSLRSVCEVLPLYGRLSNSDQQRVFSPGPKRRVIVATNVAETSLTIPRIRCVIDTGLARLSRYQPRTRTKRLPVEGISQSSARQRAGRAGRVRDGVCVRLYSEEDLLKRPVHTQPEIQRANLAEVILRMTAFRLGRIETFPFLNPPSPAAIQSGYELLHELGALDDAAPGGDSGSTSHPADRLTPLGKSLARLPLDPTLGRMLLHAREEQALPEMLVIAAGLSIPDPRERPENAREKASLAQQAFAAKDSDFLSLLRIWQASPDSGAQSSLNALRRFCKASFLSFVRMREWRDLHRQLADAMDVRDTTLPDDSLSEKKQNAIHRSILCGLIGHVAKRSAANQYKGMGGKELVLWPGSQLYSKRVKPGKEKAPAADSAKGPGTPAESTRQPEWIVAGEIVQTSQLFARTVAGIQADWVIDLAPHLCRFQHSEPRWEDKAGRVMCVERVLVHGFEIRRRGMDYGKIRPVEATALFVEHALLDRDADRPAYPFVQANLRLCDKLRAALSRSRETTTLHLQDLEESLRRFYLDRLQGVSSFHDLNGLAKKHPRDWLLIPERDLTPDHLEDEHIGAFPESYTLGNSVLPLTYTHAPGRENDGVSVKVPLPLVPHLREAELFWMVPGNRAQLIDSLLRALPKRFRKTLQPIEDKVNAILAAFQPGKEPLLAALARHLNRAYQLGVAPEDWPPESIPIHLRPRIEVVGANGQTAIQTGRDLGEIQRALADEPVPVSPAWKNLAAKIERHALTSWSFGDLPESLTVELVGGLPLLAWPGLRMNRERSGVDVLLFSTPEERDAGQAEAVLWLATQHLAKDIAWLKKELSSFTPKAPYHNRSGAQNKATLKSAPASFGDAFQSLAARLSVKSTADSPRRSPFLQAAALREQAVQCLCRELLRLEPGPLAKERFDTMLNAAKKDLPGLAWKLKERVNELSGLESDLQNLALDRPHPTLQEDLARLLPEDLLARTPFSRLAQLPRYLKAIEIRARRHDLAPAKDAAKAEALTEFTQPDLAIPKANREAFRWMLEEFRVQLFAPELGAAETVSAKRLRALLG